MASCDRLRVSCQIFFFGLLFLFDNLLHGSDFFTGEWNGTRQRAHDAGIDFFAAYANDLMGNPVGGISHGFTNAGALDTALTVDLEKIARMKGLSFFNSISWCSGSSLSAKRIGNQFSVQNLYQGETIKLAELYLQESMFDQNLNIKAGRLCSGNDFITSPLYFRYVMGAINANPAAAIVNASFSTYPFATWGAYLDFQIYSFIFKFGVYNNNANIWKNKYHGVNFTFTSQHGVMWISEWTYRLNRNEGHHKLAGNYTIGGYYVTGKTAEFEHDHSVSNFGYYVMFDQMLYHERSKIDHNLTVWGVLLLAPPDRNVFPLFLAAGLVDQGMFRSRPDDALCLAVAYGYYSADMRQVERLAKRMAISSVYGSQQQSFETDIELNYWFQATKWLSLTPVVQYIIRPKGYGTIPNALVAGMQIAINL